MAALMAIMSHVRHVTQLSCLMQHGHAWASFRFRASEIRVQCATTDHAEEWFYIVFAVIKATISCSMQPAHQSHDTNGLGPGCPSVLCNTNKQASEKQSDRWVG